MSKHRLLFTQRYSDLIDNIKWPDGIGWIAQNKLQNIFYKYVSNEVPEYSNKSSDWDKLIAKLEYRDDKYVDYIITSSNLCVMFDLAELYTETASHNGRAFAHDFNDFMDNYNMPYRLCENEVLIIDSQQFEARLKRNILSQIASIPKFQKVWDEYKFAEGQYTRQEYAGAIHSACNSYESCLRIITGDNNEYQNIPDLITELIDDGYIPDSDKCKWIRADKKHDFWQTPTRIRNEYGGHGGTEEAFKPTKELANFQLNLVGCIETYLIQEYTAKISDDSKA